MSCNGYLGNPLELPKGSQASFRVVRGNLGLLSSRCRGLGPHLTLRGETRGFSHMVFLVAGSSGFLSSCEGDVKEPLMLPQGSQPSFQVARENLGFLSSCCRGIGPQVELRQETWDSSRVAMGISWFLSRCDGNLRDPLRLAQGSQASFQIVRGTSGFLSSGCRDIRPHLE